MTKTDFVDPCSMRCNRVAGGGPVCKHMCRECLFIFIISDHMCTGKYEVDFAYPGNK